MGVINRFTKKCIFCKIKDDKVKYITAFGMYSGLFPGNWYHQSCLKEICCDPENNLKDIDMALDIIDRINTFKDNQKTDLIKLNMNCKLLKKQCNNIEEK